jgi:hypothetical protein
MQSLDATAPETSRRKRRWRRLRRIGSVPLAVLAALILAFEDWLWDPLTRLTSWLSRHPPVRWLAAGLAALPGPLALFAFALPALALLPLKIAALALIGSGHALAGAALFVVAKLVGTALLAWIWNLTQAKLLRIGWFAALHARFVAIKRALYGFVFGHPMVVLMRQKMRHWRDARKRRRAAGRAR